MGPVVLEILEFLYNAVQDRSPPSLNSSIRSSVSAELRLVSTRTPTPATTQPCIPPGSLNRVPASAGVMAGMSPLPGGR